MPRLYNCLCGQCDIVQEYVEGNKSILMQEVSNDMVVCCSQCKAAYWDKDDGSTINEFAFDAIVGYLMKQWKEE